MSTASGDFQSHSIPPTFSGWSFNYPQHEVFYDQQIPGGHRWWTYILNEIASADLFLYLMSNDSLDSDACRSEFTEAVRLEKYVLPVIIRPKTDINRAEDTAPAIREINWIDLSDGFGDDRNVEKLYASISNLLLQATHSPRAAQPRQAATTFNMDDVQGKIVNIGGVVNIHRDFVDAPQQPTPAPPENPKTPVEATPAPYGAIGGNVQGGTRKRTAKGRDGERI